MDERKFDVITGEHLHVPIKHWTRGVPFEDAARKQLENVAALPFVYRHVAAMPDVHWGRGATIGSVIATKGAIIPAAVGVDIGCGMSAVQTGLRANDLGDNLKPYRDAIEQAVPHGRTDNGGANDRGAWGNVPEFVSYAWSDTVAAGYAKIIAKRPRLAHHRPVNQLCSLGTGNHFIEVCLDEADRVWLTLHSGSRGPGNAIGSHFIELAKRDMERWFIHLPDADLAYLPVGSEHFDDYIEAVEWAQSYAAENRSLMMGAMLRAVSGVQYARGCPGVVPTEAVISCHHNYVARESHFGENVIVTRKGAVRARLGDLGIIPGSMGARSYIVRGKGSVDSFTSCSHGAGRRMSRGEAKKTFTLADHAAATAGVECRKDADVIDETPGAYKDIDAVMEAQRDLVDVVAVLRQVVCVKG